MNVLMVHNHYKIPGGEDTVVSNETEMLRTHGHKVILYTRNNDELETMGIFTKMRLPFTAIFSLKTYKEIKSLIKKRKIDIVHVHNTLTLISPSVYYAAYNCGVPVVQTVHNFRLLCPGATFCREGKICEECVEHGLKTAVKYKCYRNSFIQTIIASIVLKINRTIGIYKKINYICLTDFNKQKFEQANSRLHIFDNDKIFVKPNYMEVDIALNNDSERKNQYLFAGRLDELKGIRELINTWIELEKELGEDMPILYVCGDGPEKSWCENIVKGNRNSTIRLLGYKPKAYILELMRQSKALILPSKWYEGFPMTILESWSQNTPVIGRDIGNIGSVLIDGINGIKLKEFTPDSLKDAFGRLPKKCENISNYEADNNYKILMRIYDEITSDGGIQ